MWMRCSRAAPAFTSWRAAFTKIAAIRTRPLTSHRLSAAFSDAEFCFAPEKAADNLCDVSGLVRIAAIFVNAALHEVKAGAAREQRIHIGHALLRGGHLNLRLIIQGPLAI